nr:MAG TPA: hypothetical protein [Caudoviricetes sp.]
MATCSRIFVSLITPPPSCPADTGRTIRPP